MNLFKISTPDIVLAKEWIKKLEKKGFKLENTVTLEQAVSYDWDVTGIIVDKNKKTYFLYYGMSGHFKDFCSFTTTVSFTRANKLIKEM